MRPTPFVMLAPIFDNDFRLLHSREYLAVQQIVTQLADETLVTAVLCRQNFSVLRRRGHIIRVRGTRNFRASL